jgi:cell division initiation protein
MAKITIVDIQHKTFKKKLQGYDPADVDQFLDEIIESIEDDQSRYAALDAETHEMRDRISHFKAMEESLNSTLLLAQRTADEVKAFAHKEADMIRAEAKMMAEREIASLGDRIAEARREYQNALDTTEKARSELRSLLMSHLSLLERPSLTRGDTKPMPAAAPPAPTNGIASPEESTTPA